MDIIVGSLVGGISRLGGQVMGVVMEIKEDGVVIVHDRCGKNVRCSMRGLYLWSRRPSPKRDEGKGRMRLRQLQRQER
jgi:hypothetical protein